MITVALAALLLTSPALPRERIRFDDNWKFLRVPITDAPSVRGPFQWEWKAARLTNGDPQELPDDLSAGDWKATQIGENVLRNRSDRFAWYRTNLGPLPKGAIKTLAFESVDDNAVVFLNGKRLFKHVGFGSPFKVPMNDAWNATGPNELVVLIENTDGAGGLNDAVDFERPESQTASPPMSRKFDDSKWRTVHLPHDYVVEGTFDPNGDTGHGSLPKPIGYYRKSFTAPANWRGKSIWIDFDGVYRNSTVYLNGKKLGSQPSGYMGFRYDISRSLELGKTNEIAVTVDPRKNEGWWYEGGGIYRHVWMNVANPAHFVPDSIFARAKIEANQATVSVDTEVTQPGEVTSVIYDPNGKLVGAVPMKSTSGRHSGTLVLDKPILWDLNHPRLYKAVSYLMAGRRVVDKQISRFGIRDIRWDKDKGFFLNGKAVKIKGTCNHLDHAGVGVAVPDSLQKWRIQQLLDMGSNAWRTSHNPPSAEFLDYCDEMGMLVLDETRHFGDTTQAKSPPGTTGDDLSEVKAQIMRDRNHPSIIAWSLYNEEGLETTKEGAELFKTIRTAVNKLDGTRLCTGADNSGGPSGIVDVTDLFGFNYNIGSYDRVRPKHLDTPLFGSETASAVSTRGEYKTDKVKGYVDAYDDNPVPWGATAENAWKGVNSRDWMAGEFVWTGFDYKGEPTPYGWPCINSHFGILDICGFPKDSYYYYQAWWKSKPMVHILPHWNGWTPGDRVKVWTYSNAEIVRLSLNGKVLEEQPNPRDGHLEWSVVYQPGTLSAVGLVGGRVVSRDKVETTGAPAAIRLVPSTTRLKADGEDVSVVRVEILDAKGRVIPTASNRVTFSITGAAQNGGVGNGDPSDHDPDKASYRKAFNGLAMVLVQSNSKAGTATLTATSPGLKPAKASFTAK